MIIIFLHVYMLHTQHHLQMIKLMRENSLTHIHNFETDAIENIARE